MKHKRSEVRYHSDVFFKYALAGDDEDAKFIRHGIIEYLTGIKVNESTVLNPEIITKTANKKNVILDVYVRDEEGREYDFEMQIMGTMLTEMKRFELYGSKMITEQLEEGDSYTKLQSIYQIIFIDKLSYDKNELVRFCQVQDQHGVVEYEGALTHRIYIHLPAINNIAKTRPFLQINDFERMCFLFKNDENSDILKSQEGLVKKLMEKHEQMMNDERIWSYAKAQEFGEQRYENIKNDCFDVGKAEGEAKGIAEGYCDVLRNQIKKKYQVDASNWLSTLSKEDLIQVSNAILDTTTYEELQSKLS